MCLLAGRLNIHSALIFQLNVLLISVLELEFVKIICFYLVLSFVISHQTEK